MTVKQGSLKKNKEQKESIIPIIQEWKNQHIIKKFNYHWNFKYVNSNHFYVMPMRLNKRRRLRLRQFKEV